jgi:hypothetical protein
LPTDAAAMSMLVCITLLALAVLQALAFDNSRYDNVSLITVRHPRTLMGSRRSLCEYQHPAVK